MIYLSILNLPREDRYKIENVILLGIIPNLTHEPNTLEYLLRHLVEELKIFYKDGIHLPKTDRLIKCVLICVTCDLPATRKVCGFLGHSAKLGSKDRHRKLLTQPCYGAVVEQGNDTLCNEVLFNCKKTEKGTLEYTPKHIYCYQPLSKSLDNLLSRLGFLDKCNAWRRRPATRGFYSDIYDGFFFFF